MEDEKIIWKIVSGFYESAERVVIRFEDGSNFQIQCRGWYDWDVFVDTGRVEIAENDYYIQYKLWMISKEECEALQKKQDRAYAQSNRREERKYELEQLARLQKKYKK